MNNWILLKELSYDIWSDLKSNINRKTKRTWAWLEYDRFKWNYYYRVMAEWLVLKEKGIKLENYLLNGNYHQIVIYGCGDLGKCLADELLSCNQITVNYILDRNKIPFYRNILTVTFEDLKSMDVCNIDAVIITPVYCYLEIAASLCGIYDCPIISLEDMIHDSVQKK